MSGVRSDPKMLDQKRETVFRVLYEAGYGSSSRLCERLSERLGMTPAIY